TRRKQQPQTATRREQSQAKQLGIALLQQHGKEKAAERDDGHARGACKGSEKGTGTERHQRQTTGEPSYQGLHAAYQTLRRLAGSQNIAREGKQRNGQECGCTGETIELDHDGRGVNASSPEQEPGEGTEHRKQGCSQECQEHQQQAQEDHAPASGWTTWANVSIRRTAKRRVIAPNPSGIRLYDGQEETPK